jgi:hypothetical protein
MTLNPEGELQKNFTLGGVSGPVQGSLYLPASTRFGGPRPLAFLVPSGRMIHPAKTVTSLAGALGEQGIALFAFQPPSHALSGRQVSELFRESILAPRINPHFVSLIGFEDGADQIARDYYDFYRIRFPRAAVLVRPSVSALHLNNLTCPYLVLHARGEGSTRIEEAVAHHLSRYGDLTRSHELRDGEDIEAIQSEIADWLPGAMKEGLRPQERAARPAA